MKKIFTQKWLAALAAFLTLGVASAQDSCPNFETYFVNIPHDDQANTTLYKVNLDASPALETELVIGRPAHIAISPQGLIYVVTVTGKVAVYDPSIGVLGDYELIIHGEDLVFNTPQAAVDPATGELYVASADDNAVYVVDPLTGAATHFASVDISGGDLVFDAAGDLWTINRYNDIFYNISDGISSFAAPSGNINGVGLLADGNFVISNTGADFLAIMDAAGNVIDSVFIDMVIGAGDIASGCVGSEPVVGCYAMEVVDYVQGPQTNGAPVAGSRSDPSVTLGEPDRSNAPGGFFSLGVGGHITLAFSGAIFDGPGNDIRIWETSYAGDDCSGPSDERADIEVSQDGINFYPVGTICRDGEVDIATSGLDYVTLIRITNAETTGTLDGYDVDGVEAIHGCDPIPLIYEGLCHASEVVEYIEGVQDSGAPLDADRNDPNQALGEPERTHDMIFTTLGYGGSITLGFNGTVPNGPGADLEIVETTFTNGDVCNTYPEFADVYVSLDGVTFDLAGTVCRGNPFVDISDAGDYSEILFVKIVNNDTLSTTFDGYDLDGVVAIHNCEIDDDSDGLQPTVAMDAQLMAYPNPSEGTVHIQFELAEDGFATLEVFDMSGRSLGVLFHERATAGHEYRLPFNGNGVPAGLYPYKLTTPEGVHIGKIIIQ